MRTAVSGPCASLRAAPPQDGRPFFIVRPASMCIHHRVAERHDVPRHCRLLQVEVDDSVTGANNAALAPDWKAKTKRSKRPAASRGPGNRAKHCRPSLAKGFPL